MSRNNEFLTYKEFKRAEHLMQIIQTQNSKDLYTPEDEKIAKFTQASKRAHVIKDRAKKSFGLNDITFKTWIKANDEFIKILTEQEKAQLTLIEQSYYDALEHDDDCGIAELQELFITLTEMNYTKIINEYFEDSLTR